MRPKKPDSKFMQIVVLILLCFGLYALVNHLESVVAAFRIIGDLLEPLTVGAILAFLLSVPMRALERLFCRIQQKRKWKVRERLNSTLSLIFTYLGAFLIIFLVLYALIPELINAAPSIVSSLETGVGKLVSFLQGYHINTEKLETVLSGIDLDPVVNQLVNNYAQILQTSWTAVGSVVSFFTVAVTGFVISIYILANKKKLLGQVRRVMYAYLRPSTAKRIGEVCKLTNETFSNFISGQCMEAVILGLMFFVTMSILRLPYSLVISVFISFMALIPYVGAFLGCVVGVVLILTQSPMQALIFVVTFLVLQQLEGQLIYPKVVGSSVGLPGIWTLVSVYAGGKLFGIVGMLFFIPLTSVVYSLLRINVNQRLRRRSQSGQEDGAAGQGEEKQE